MNSRNRNGFRTSIALAVLLICFQFAAFAGGNLKDTAPYQVASIKAYLYFYQKGTFSENIIDNPAYGPGSLWNTIIGDGSVGENAIGPSEATMVVVDVIGKPGDYNPKRTLSFVAVESGKIKIEKISKTSILNKSGHIFLAFWLYDTGCRPIVLTAKLLGQPVESKLEKKIDFECGE